MTATRLAALSVMVGVWVFAGGWTAAAEREHDTAGTATVTRGTVVSVDPLFGFVLEDGTSVEVAAGTQWQGVTGLQDLQPGDSITLVGTPSRVGGRPAVKAGGVRVASPSGRVAPIDSPVCLPPRETLSGVTTSAGQMGATQPPQGALAVAAKKGLFEIEGAVISIGAEHFEVETVQQVLYTVVVNDATEFRDLTGLEDLDIGDTVRVRGDLDETVITAARVELRGGDGGTSGGGVDFESTGLVVELRPPDSFAFSDDRVYRVDGQTVFDDTIVSYAGIAVGQYLEVKAVYEGGGSYRAAKIKYEGDRDQGQGYRIIEGTVATVAASSMTLTDSTIVHFATTTEFNGDADRREDLVPGWAVEAYVLLNASGQFVALEIRADDSELSSTSGQEYEPQEAVVLLEAGADPAGVASRYDATVSGAISTLASLFTFEREIDDDLLAEIAADPDVLAVEPNFHFRDPESTRRRFVIVDRSPTIGEYTGQSAAVRHGIAKAHTVSEGRGTVVAVMDTGVEYCHPLVKGHLLAGGVDFIDGDLAPWETADGVDDDGDGEIDEAAGHGTFVASVVALAAPGARILPYRVLDDDGGGTAFSLALALADAIDRGVDVINLSLAYHTRSGAVDLLLEEAAARGIVIVAAAGNDASATLPFPAVDSHVMAVTALRADGAALADFANRGVAASLAAVGEDIYGALFGGEYGTSSGTSMAAPFAAAGAALVKSLDPAVSADIVRQVLEQSGVVMTDGTWSGSSLDLGRAVLFAQP